MSAGFFIYIMTFEFTIGIEEKNTRLDSLVCIRMDSVTRSRAVKLISAGLIRVNGQVKKSGYKLNTGDVVTGQLDTLDKTKLVEPENIILNVQYEDDYIIVIDKPSGMVVHPGAGNETGTLVNALLYHDPKISSAGSERVRAGIVHRLDKDTSGLIVAAKTDRALEFLLKEFKYRRVEKRYLALVEGSELEDSGIIDLPIARHPVKRKQMAVNQESGKKAVSVWQVKERYPDATLVEVLLKTGRTHQIRVHFYAIGHPLVDDPVYQFRRNRKKISKDRQMLHSHYLAFRHPYSGRRVEFRSEPPDDFIRKMALLRK